ncbi:MAG: hypothetical protein AAF721_34180 [Myxococcota bacterium]
MRRLAAISAAAVPLLAACPTDDAGGIDDPPGVVATGSDDGGATTSGTDTGGQSESTESGSPVADSSDGPPTCEAPEVACGSICADLDSDVSNCGLCGRTCIIANAEAGCAAGECGMVACEQGFSDCDGLLANGCEAEVDCSGGPCMTECGSTGTAECDGGCEPVCTAPAETCNAADDDCNAQCDEGPLPGCRAGVHRSLSPTLGHFYTTDIVEAASGDFSIEAQDFYFVYVDAVDGLVPLFRCLKGNGRRFYTTSTDCEGTGGPELTVGFMAPDDRCGATPLYRVYNAGSDAHFYTTSAAERDNAIASLGYVDEGIEGYIWAAP